MDTIAEEIMASRKGLKVTNELIIGILLWMDDVVSCVEGQEDQLEMLQKLDHFAKDHKFKWGNDKCQVMPIGTHSKEIEWNLGDLKIKTCANYRYLGDVISSNGKNKDNIEARKNKITASTVSITTIAESEVLNRIETSVILQLHETINVPSLLNNAESWDLLKGEQKELDQIEIQSIKRLFDLPTKTPTPAIIHSLGIPYTSMRIDKKQLLYLHRLLNRANTHWTVQLLKTLGDLNIGWHKRIVSILEKNQLPVDFETIKRTPFNTWKNQVTTSIEKEHKNRLKEDCHKKEGGVTIPKTKTVTILSEIDMPNYERKPKTELLLCTKNECKTIIIARYGMLECGTNYKGTLNSQCTTCNTIDNEEHRLNECIRFKEKNFHGTNDKIPFSTIYSDNIEELRALMSRISQVWNVRTGHGTMNI